MENLIDLLQSISLTPSLPGPKPNITRFHPCHGENIVLFDHDTVAYRKKSFSNTVIFSETPLQPKEIFLIEIEQNETGWSGHMRIGLTQLDPLKLYETGSIPKYATDLRDLGPTWMYAITQKNKNAFLCENEDGTCVRIRSTVGHEDCSIFEKYYNPKNVPLRLLKSSRAMPDISPTEMGSRIGVVYIPTGGIEAEMHFIINGEDMGAFVNNIPYMDGPLHAVVDVYGTTKKVRIIQLYNVPSLKATCREAILSLNTMEAVSSLPLSKSLKEYLLYNI